MKTKNLKFKKLIKKLYKKFSKTFIYKIIANLTLLKIIKITFIGFVTLILIIFSINKYIDRLSRENIYNDLDNVPSKQTGIILGALVFQDGSLSDMLKDRADTAIQLYKQDKIRKILVSGDHGRIEYDEVNAVKDYLLEQAIPSEDIFMDHAGFDTYDSIYRARDIFLVDSAIIITQEFHLPRAIFIAKNLDLEAVGMKADKHIYRQARRAAFREKLANVKAFFNITFNSSPKFGGKEIPITGNSRLSWD